MSQISPDIYISESKKYFKEISSKLRRLIDKSNNKALIQISKSIHYRWESVIYHLILISNTYAQIRNKVSNSTIEKILEDKDYIDIEYTALFFFDDVIFNVVSYIDYIASFIGQYRYNKSLKWNSFKNKYCSDSSNNGPLRETINKYHRYWCEPLLEYRGDIFHRKKDSAEVSKQILVSTTQSSVDLKIPIPYSFLKVLEKVISPDSPIGIRKLPGDEDFDKTSILSSVFLIIDITFLMTDTLLKDQIDL